MQRSTLQWEETSPNLSTCPRTARSLERFVLAIRRPRPERHSQLSFPLYPFTFPLSPFSLIHVHGRVKGVAAHFIWPRTFEAVPSCRVHKLISASLTSGLMNGCNFAATPGHPADG
ncbi:hypothetical protein FOMG_18282 [Fusarium oxysporum f. sp. melonis 26406]|uniref:Uncharacterized protein n=1 Tax=Fusarium oxysporum f. sp. melonis 26406 TaxID=1089452 RepID=W9Z108_FUSOX|nr:hypothetical protein FOMG_18282 [Fusarium oxysporum f. sp. melonis 26406]